MRRVVLIIMLLTVAVSSWALQLYDFTGEVVERINHLRSHPSQVARTLGVHPEKTFVGGVPLTPDNELSSLALWQLERCVDAGTLEVSRDALEDEARQRGLDLSLITGVVAAVAFVNYIPPEDALDSLLQVLETSALEGKPMGAPLLFPLYTRVGVAFGLVQAELNGTSYNAYVISMVLEAPAGDLQNVPVVLGWMGGNCTLTAVPLDKGAFSYLGRYADGSYFFLGEPGLYAFYASPSECADEAYRQLCSSGGCYYLPSGLVLLELSSPLRADLP